MKTEELQGKVQLVYKKCCNYACECTDDKLRELLGVAANECRKHLSVTTNGGKNC
ncbi:MAG: hypothetical protein K2M95_02585 [Clostridiales bacterium]|nr:hypothetical protein [Clostridiales bacterium]